MGVCHPDLEYCVDKFFNPLKIFTSQLQDVLITSSHPLQHILTCPVVLPYLQLPQLLPDAGMTFIFGFQVHSECQYPSRRCQMTCMLLLVPTCSSVWSNMVSTLCSMLLTLSIFCKPSSTTSLPARCFLGPHSTLCAQLSRAIP